MKDSGKAEEKLTGVAGGQKQSSGNPNPSSRYSGHFGHKFGSNLFLINRL
jgi:hypothetical protein